MSGKTPTTSITAPRRRTRTVMVGSVPVGSGHDISVQSMCTVRTEHLNKAVDQIGLLESAGCDIIRVAANTPTAAKNIGRIRERINIPVIADVHYDVRLALGAVESGADGIRVNPGNLGAEDLKLLARSLKGRERTALRIGVNSGSVEPEFLVKHGGPTAEAMCESALMALDRFEKAGVGNIKISIKSPDLDTTAAACRLLAARTDCPLHLGITEAGTRFTGAVRSAVGLGLLLSEGLGDTIRVSLSGDPLHEVRAGVEVLRALGLREEGVRVVACPTCGRTRIDVAGLAARIEAATAHMKGPLRVAVMGCRVNGPGEAAAADIGIAGGRGRGLIFMGGEPVRWTPENRMFDDLLSAVRRMLGEE